MKKFISFLVIILNCSIIRAADSTEVKQTAPSDTIVFYPRGMTGSTMAVRDSTDYEAHLTQNPTVALFKSMLVPGLGQLGNRRYVKAAIVIGMQSWLISSAVANGQDASDLRHRFEEAVDITERNSLYEQYLDKKDSRNKYTWFAVIVTFVSMFDAYADAHLSGYPRDDKPPGKKLNLNLGPESKSGVYASVTYSF